MQISPASWPFAEPKVQPRVRKALTPKKLKELENRGGVSELGKVSPKNRTVGCQVSSRLESETGSFVELAGFWNGAARFHRTCSVENNSWLPGLLIIVRSLNLC